MKVVVKKLSELKRPELNVRMHTNKQLQEFRRSLDMFGQIRPIVCDEEGVILAGNGLYETLLSMGKETADCYVVKGLSDKEKKKLMLADNRIYSLGVDDMEAFDAIIAELQDADIPGYDEELLNTLIASVGDVDSMLSDYGTFAPECQQSMQKASTASSPATMSTAAPETVPGASPAPPPVSSADTDEPAQEVQNVKYVICPKCGERIPL